MAQSVRVYVKKQVRFQELAFVNQQMVKLGTVGLASIKNRVHDGLGPDDGTAKPLSPKWRIIKGRMGLRPIRDLRGHGRDYRGGLQRSKKRRKLGKFIGHMLDDLKVLSVTAFSATIGLTSHAARIKGRANQRRQPWLVLSPRNREAVKTAFRLIVAEGVKGLKKVLPAKAA